ncbi:hypothetical protein [Pseudomonas typographi]|uniref:hypothetical protein n=1 Tax=Pseudomonas typographi TaxID=2715964 RepID=UPI0016887DA0|nr:hypothetical protein [Pseudomonas typographi]MBD1554827.1 hypothetical protein [Pseudomonas typographi]
MAASYRQLHPNLHGDLRKQWVRSFHGSTIASWVRDDFFKRCPALEQLFLNPLWEVVSESAVPMNWDDLADTIRIDDRPLDGITGKLTKSLLDRVDWPCFCVHLVLLQTRNRHFETYRLWLAKNFVSISSWVCVQSPCVFISKEFKVQLLTALRNAPSEFRNNITWAEYSHCQQDVLQLLKLSSEAGWLSAQDQQLALLWWNLSPAQRRAELGRLYTADDGTVRFPTAMSSATYQAWRRKRQCWLDHPIALNGFNCGFPSEGRLLRVA